MQSLSFRKAAFAAFAATLGMAGLWAQQPDQEAPESAIVTKETTAVGYTVGGGSTRVDMNGSDAMPQVAGEAKVEAKKTVTQIELELKNLSSPTKFGSEFLTFVLWAVSPDGRTSNLGEILVNNGEGKLKATSQLQTFSLVVTAEPYYAVRQPSEIVVAENDLRKNTKGKIFPIKQYRLMKRAHYQQLANPLALSLDLKNIPLEMYQARNSIMIAKMRGADKDAQEIFSKAEGALSLAEAALARKSDKKEIISQSRRTVQFAEDARALATQRQEERRIAEEKAAAAAKAKADAEAKAAAEAAVAKARADAEAARQAELSAAREAQLKAEADARAARQKAEADAQAARLKAEADARAAQLKAEAEIQAAKQKAEADAAAARAATEAAALRAREEAAKMEAERAKKAAEELRAKLLDQFNRILETRDTERGLVVNMGDVLFDTGKFNLRPAAREALARLSGIVAAYSTLKLDVEGHTDSTGSDELNQKLSEQRAGAVQTYLTENGVPAANVTAKGLGKTMPVADNATAAGRQKNRRVEIIVSGEVIGTKIGQ